MVVGMDGSALNLSSASNTSLALGYFGSIVVLNSIIVGSIVLNVSVILITYTGKCMEKNPNSIYVLCLAIADLLKGLFFLTNGIIVEYYNFQNRPGHAPFVMCVLPRALVHMASLFSGYTLLLTTFVQYYAVARPHFHKKWMKGKFSRLAIALGWTFCVIQTLCVFITLVKPDTGIDIECTDSGMFENNATEKHIVEVIDFWLSLSILTLMNGKLIREIKRIGNQVSNVLSESNENSLPVLSLNGNMTPCFTAVMELQQQSDPSMCATDIPGTCQTEIRHRDTNTGQVPKIRNKHWKPFITLIVLVASFAISLGPYAVYITIDIVTSQGKGTTKQQTTIVRIMSFGVLVNTLINPLIYAFRIPVYRQFIEKKILKTRL